MRFQQLFPSAKPDPMTGKLSALAARDFFMLSGLATDDLAQVWYFMIGNRFFSVGAQHIHIYKAPLGYGR